MTDGAESRGLVFCGIKHCGKTAMAKLAAVHFDLTFADTDDELLKFADAGETVRALYKRVGADEFRRLEARAVSCLAGRNLGAYSVALGGGVPVNPLVSRELLGSLGRVVYLDVAVDMAYLRIAAEGLPPFLAGCADPQAEFARQCAGRRPAYAKIADITVRIERELPPEETFELVKKELAK
ncbi:MAG: shikimate kinase [Victivallaceae bacterium]|nr:shikimate kinase [Victivallaceae bacterium]